MKALDFDSMRKRMVEEQLIPRGISDRRVLEAFGKVPRERFVQEEFWESAYSDHPLPIDEGQTISQPYMVALMTECLALKASDKVLEIGTGSGYQAAILAEIVKEVYSVDRFSKLTETARGVLEKLGYKNVKLRTDDGTLGWNDHAPYDGIVVTAGAPGIPQSLVRQLNDGGRLVIPIGGGFGQVLTIVEKKGNAIQTREICGCVFVPLIGKEGWLNSRMEL